MRKAQRKDFHREVKKSLNRFLSILFIVALGVAFFTGVRSSEPDMRISCDRYYDENKFMDIRVIGTLGMTDEDIEEISRIPGVEQAEGGYRTEAFCSAGDKNYIMLVYSACEQLNRLKLEEGRLPVAADECMLDSVMLINSGLKIGDRITLSSGTEEAVTEHLSTDTFTIVGIGSYAEYLSWTRPSAGIGSGKSDAYLFLPKASFTDDYYHTVYATVEGAEELLCFGDEYEDRVGEITEKIESIADAACTKRYNTLVSEAQEEIDKNNAEVADAEQKLADAALEISNAEDKLADGKEELKTAGQELLDARAELTAGFTYLSGLGMEQSAEWNALLQQEQQLQEAELVLEENRQELQQAEQELTKAKETYKTEKAEAEPEIADAKQKLAEAQEELDRLEMPEWYVLDRSSIQTFVEYDQDAERIGAIGKVFPIIFFLVAALVSLTTMTRMVEENRTQIGTFKALGYSKFSIAAKYLKYALYASLLGGALGVAVGSVLLPYVIISAYAILYSSITVILTPVNWGIAILAVLLANACTVLAALFACYRELASTPAVLMRPAAPPSGKRVFLEHISILWKRLSFTGKATVRNLFRYKKRFFMTIFGIGGCTALLLVGFGLRDSIKEIVNNQYRKLWTYDISLTVKEKEETLVPGLLSGYNKVEGCMYGSLRTMDVQAGGTTKSAQIFVPETLEHLSDFLVLRDRVSDEVYTMPTEGVAISEKLARVLSLKIGDTITLEKSATERYSAKVSLIVENYLYHYVYMSAETYGQLFGEPAENNQLMIKTGTLSEEEQAELGTLLMQQESISGITFISEMEETVQSMMSSLDLVVWVLIAAAALLAFIVIYNLNNINIVERRRELATLKVLGFYDGEVANYVYRENVALTLLGIAVGMGMGVVLHQYVIKTCEIDMIMFGRQIKGISYLLSVLFTAVFAGIVNLTMFAKLRKIDMVESLKSVE